MPPLFWAIVVPTIIIILLFLGHKVWRRIRASDASRRASRRRLANEQTPTPVRNSQKGSSVSQQAHSNDSETVNPGTVNEQTELGHSQKGNTAEEQTELGHSPKSNATDARTQLRHSPKGSTTDARTQFRRSAQSNTEDERTEFGQNPNNEVEPDNDRTTF
jgi:hypothetical protein